MLYYCFTCKKMRTKNQRIDLNNSLKTTKSLKMYKTMSLKFNYLCKKAKKPI